MVDARMYLPASWCEDSERCEEAGIPEEKGIRADRYMSELAEEEWFHLKVRNTAKGQLTGDYHFHTVYVFDEDNHRMLRRLLVIRRTVNRKGEYEYKYSFTNANLEQYT